MRAAGLMNDAPGDALKIIDGIVFKKNDKVRLRLGKRRADAVDILMDNKLATIENIYTDYEGKTYIAVTIDDDPGREMKHEMGLYLYFNPDEIEHV
jgi:hypothetical protein